MPLMHSDGMDALTWRIDVRYVPKIHNGWKSSGRDLPTFYVYGVTTPEAALKEARDIVGDRWVTTTYNVIDKDGNIRITHTVER